MPISKVANRMTSSTGSAGTLAGASILGETIGNYLIARIAMDNSGGGGAARTLTITDDAGNTWTQIVQNYDPGAASAGTTAFLCYAKIVNHYAGSGGLINGVTFTFSGSGMFALVVEEWAGIDPTTPVRTASIASTGTGTAPTPGAYTASQYQPGDLIYMMAAIEGPSGDAYTEDNDTLEGSWVTNTSLGTTNTTADLNQKVVGAYKIPTGTTGAQQWTPTITNRDWASIGIVFAAAPTGGQVKPRVGGSFSQKPTKVRAGGVFVTKPVKIRQGGSWILA